MQNRLIVRVGNNDLTGMAAFDESGQVFRNGFSFFLPAHTKSITYQVRLDNLSKILHNF